MLLAIAAPQAKNKQHENEGRLGLPGGYDVPFRLVEPGDAGTLQRFLERCSERAIYQRFFGSLDEYTAQVLDLSNTISSRTSCLSSDTNIEKAPSTQLGE